MVIPKPSSVIGTTMQSAPARWAVCRSSDLLHVTRLIYGRAMQIPENGSNSAVMTFIAVAIIPIPGTETIVTAWSP